MSKEMILEITSLSRRHPKMSFYGMYGLEAVIRLSLDPVSSPPGVARRTVVVDYLGQGKRRTLTLLRELGWSNTVSESECKRSRNTGAEHDITEKAALVVMSLLVHDIAGLEIQGVLKLGDGADYAAEVLESGEQTRIEVSGILQDDLTTARGRVERKTAQLLSRQRHGYVSVTTFSLAPGGTLHSFLHHVGTPPRRRKKKGKAS